jgi:hypothetical protein
MAAHYHRAHLEAVAALNPSGAATKSKLFSAHTDAVNSDTPVASEAADLTAQAPDT